MKKLFTVLMLTLAMNFLAILGGVGWLFQSGHLDKEKVKQVRELIFSPATQPSATQPSGQTAATAPSMRIDDLLAEAAGRPASEQVDFIQSKFDQRMLELELRQQQLLDLKRQVDLANVKLAEDRRTLTTAQKTLDQQQKETVRLANDKGFQDSLALYNTMIPKQVKTIFMTLGEATVQQYMEAMQPRVATKIIKEFKTPDETAFIQRVLERMRLAQATPPPDAAQPAQASAQPAQASAQPAQASAQPAQASADRP